MGRNRNWQQSSQWTLMLSQAQTQHRGSVPSRFWKELCLWLTCPQKIKGHVAEEPDSHGTQLGLERMSLRSGEAGWTLDKVIVCVWWHSPCKLPGSHSHPIETVSSIYILLTHQMTNIFFTSLIQSMLDALLILTQVFNILTKHSIATVL